MEKWPTTYSCKLMEPGVISYEDAKIGIALIKKETIDRIGPSLIGKPVVVRHQDVNTKNYQDVAVGYVTGVHFNSADGWHYVDFLITSDTVEALDRDDGTIVFKAPDGEILDGISGAYDVLNASEGGAWHDIKFDFEVLDGAFTHLALVINPRYEESNKIHQQMNCMLMNGKQAHQKIQEESPMNVLKIFKKIVNGKDEEVEKMVDVEGVEVPLSELVKTYEAEETEKTKKAELEAQNSEAKALRMAKDEDTVEIGGKKVSVSQLKACHAAKVKNAKTETDEEKAAREKKEKEDKDLENAKAEEDKKKAAEEEEEKKKAENAKKEADEAETKKKAEELENSKKTAENAKKGDEFFTQIENAGKEFVDDLPSTGPTSREEKAKVGRQRYGSREAK